VSANLRSQAASTAPCSSPRPLPQSLVVLRGTLGAANVPGSEIEFFCLAMFMIGSTLYLAIIPLIFYRLTLVQLATHDFGPPYWINMGGVAITTLAGSLLLLRMDHWELLQEFMPILKGFTVFFLGGGDVADSISDRVDDLAIPRAPRQPPLRAHSCGACCFRWACTRPARFATNAQLP
jgi:Voltage-dependent anion channel